MSMTMLLESVSRDLAAAKTQQPVVAKSQQSVPTLRLFTGADSDTSPDDVPTCADEDEEVARGESICLEKSWQGLHFLLTGDPWGGTGWQAFLLCGGIELGDDLGYGPARQFDVAEVREIAKTLNRWNGTRLWSHFDARQMTAAGIYPEIWNEPESDLREEYLEYFELLKEFVNDTAIRGHALRISIA